MGQHQNDNEFQNSQTRPKHHHAVSDLNLVQTLFNEFVGSYPLQRLILRYQNSRLTKRYRNRLVGSVENQEKDGQKLQVLARGKPSTKVSARTACRDSEQMNET